MVAIANDWYRWDALRKLGNHRLVQFTIVVPIVGYMILLNKDLAGYYALYFDAEPVGVSYRLYWLYFGFTFLGIASLVFNLRCPKLVKEYGSAAAFVAAEERTTSPWRLGEMKKQLVEARWQVLYPNARYTMEEVRCFKHNKNEHAPPGAPAWGIVIPFEEGSKEFEEEIATLREMKSKYETMVQKLEKEPPHVMTAIFVPLKDTRPRARLIVLVLYVIGFVILAVPTLEVFARVLVSLFA